MIEIAEGAMKNFWRLDRLVDSSAHLRGGDFVLVGAAAAFAQVPPPVDPAAIAKQIQTMDADWSHAANVGDVDKCISYYADDGLLLEPNAAGRLRAKKPFANRGPRWSPARNT